jgi:hypothetical protein
MASMSDSHRTIAEGLAARVEKKPGFLDDPGAIHFLLVEAAAEKRRKKAISISWDSFRSVCGGGCDRGNLVKKACFYRLRCKAGR